MRKRSVNSEEEGGDKTRAGGAWEDKNWRRHEDDIRINGLENRNAREDREEETIAKAGRKEEEGRTKGLGAMVRNRNERGTGNNIEHRKGDE